MVLDDKGVSADVLLVNTEALAKKTVDYYSIKGNATFIGDIKATLSPFTRLDVLGYNTDSTIVRVRVVYKNLVHRYFSSSSGYVPAFTLHDTLPKSTTTFREYQLTMRVKNRMRDSIDSVDLRNNTKIELKYLRTASAAEIKKIEIRCIDFNTQQMINLPCNDFTTDSKHDYYTISGSDSISGFITMFKKVLRMNVKDLNLNNSAHFGGITIFYKKHDNLYFCFDRAYNQIGDSVFLNTPEYGNYIRKIITRRTKTGQ